MYGLQPVIQQIYFIYSFFRDLAGMPATVVWGGTSQITVAPAAMVDHSPILMPGITVAPAPIQEPLPT